MNRLSCLAGSMTGSAGALNRARAAVLCQSSARSDHSANCSLMIGAGFATAFCTKLLKRAGDRPLVDHLIAVVGLEPLGIELGQDRCCARGSPLSVSTAPASIFASGCRCRRRPIWRCPVRVLRDVGALARFSMASSPSACRPAFQRAQSGRAPPRRFRRCAARPRAGSTRRRAWCAGSRWSCSAWRRDRTDRTDRAPSRSIRRRCPGRSGNSRS